MILISKILLFLSLFTGALAFLKIAGRERLLQETMLRAYDQLSEASRQRKRGEGNRRGVLGRIEERIVYSGLKKELPYLTAELYLSAQLAAGGAGFILMISITGSITRAVIAMALTILVLHGLAGYLCHRNYKKTEEELLVFLNILDSYSITASEITGIFYKVSRYLSEPLKDALEGCYFEAQTTGDTVLALQHLTERIEHPKAREIIRNLEVCSRYDADYASVVKNCRKGIADYLAYRKKRKALGVGARIEMLFLVLAGAISFTMMGTILQSGIWELLFRTVPGKGLLAFLGGVLVLFYVQVILFDRD